jgi:hypothetical protein
MGIRYAIPDLVAQVTDGLGFYEITAPDLCFHILKIVRLDRRFQSPDLIVIFAESCGWRFTHVHVARRLGGKIPFPSQHCFGSLQRLRLGYLRHKFNRHSSAREQVQEVLVNQMGEPG